MPSKKLVPRKRPGPRPPEPAPPWQVIIEHIESQNRTTIEAVEALREEFRRDTQNFRAEVHADTSLLKMMGQEHSIDIRDLKTGLVRVEGTVDRLEVRFDKLETKVDKIETKVDRLETKVTEIDEKVDKLLPREDRVAALEHS